MAQTPIYPEYEMMRQNAFSPISWMQEMMNTYLYKMLTSRHGKEGYHPTGDMMTLIDSKPDDLHYLIADMMLKDKSAPDPFSTHNKGYLNGSYSNHLDNLRHAWGDGYIIDPDYNDDGFIFHPHYIVAAFQLTLVDDAHTLLSNPHNIKPEAYIETLLNIITVFANKQTDLNPSYDAIEINRDLHNFIPYFIGTAYKALNTSYHWDGKVIEFYKLDMMTISWGGGNNFHRTRMMEAMRDPDAYFQKQEKEYIKSWLEKGKIHDPA